ncbi:LutC/YkgG family protein [Spirosoma validum]|uniref:LUD domain-containing protein n=1 Tax=Spirosoma validum TaxID=2771355 RepID=A0A927GC30_9BACT|nr:LUD domain-containing protein [Spirosoma validum]MBD2752332.1 LUD domain-containing protein [Spirosoma validum]
MSTRDQLLTRIRQNKPEPLPLPDVPTFVNESDDQFARFRDALAFVGGKLLELNPGDSLGEQLRQAFPDAERIASSVPIPEFKLVSIDTETDKMVIEQIDLAVLKGEFVVAENGAVWLPEPNMLNRSLPFITQHLVLVVDRSTLVPNMHVAYQHVDRNSLTYGTFICGPSKTADIEQSLVVGAHGARSLTIVLTTENRRKTNDKDTVPSDPHI